MHISLPSRKTRSFVSIGFTLALTAAALFAPSPQPTQAQQQGAELAQASRIVSIGSSVTEIVYALGQEDRLVARDSTSLYPPAAAQLPDIGYMRQLSPEGVLSLDPDAILAVEGSGPPETIQVLDKASVPFVSIPESFDRQGIISKIRDVGAALGASSEAERLARKVDADLAAVEASAAAIDERKRVLFILSIQGGRLLASGQGTAADGIIKLAGGVNAIDAYEGYKPLTDEAVIEARPDVILMMDRGGDLGISDAQLLANPALAATPAGQARNFLRMDGLYLLGFGPRTAEAARDLSTALYGGRDPT